MFFRNILDTKKDNKNNKNTEFMNLMGYDKNSTFKIKLFKTIIQSNP